MNVWATVLQLICARVFHISGSHGVLFGIGSIFVFGIVDPHFDLQTRSIIHSTDWVLAHACSLLMSFPLPIFLPFVVRMFVGFWVWCRVPNFSFRLFRPSRGTMVDGSPHAFRHAKHSSKRLVELKEFRVKLEKGKS